jgi:pimeloyl-ACP methyl ester carboxylesterase
VLAVTLQGHWGGPPAGRQFGVSTMADYVERAIDDAGWRRPHIAGGSLGGWVTLELARRGRAHTAIGIAPAGGWMPGGLYWRFVARWYLVMGRSARLMAPHARAWASRPRLRRLLTWHHFRRPVSAPMAAQLIEGIARTEGMEDALVSSHDWDVTRDLAGVECPVLLAFPERDYVLPWRWFGRRLGQAIPHAERRVLPGVGHAAMVDDPELVASAIAEFTSRHPGAA